jgi:hypothetical protein
MKEFFDLERAARESKKYNRIFERYFDRKINEDPVISVYSNKSNSHQELNKVEVHQ